MKKMLHKIAVVLVMVFTVVASAFGVNVSAQEPVNIVFWHGMGGVPGEALQKIVDQYNASQNEVKVDAQYQGSYDETLTKLRSTASGQEVGADIVQVFEVGTTFMIDSGLTVPVQEYIDANNFEVNDLEENLLAYFTIDDKLYSMPFNNSTPLLYYNKDMFDTAGVEVPTNLQEAFEIGPKLMEAGAAMPMSVSVYGWWLDQWFNKVGADIFDNENGRAGAPTKVVFDENGAMLKILTAWKEGVDNGTMPNIGRTGGSAEFIGGQSAMTFGSTASLRQILSEVDGRFEVGTAYYPGIDAEDTHGVSIGGASLWMIESGDDTRKEATWKFIEYLLSPEVQAEWNAATGYFPVNKKAHDTETFKKNLAEYPQFQTAIDQLHDSKPEDRGALGGTAQEMRQVFENEVENLFNGVVTPEEAVKAMAEQINAAIANYNQANQ